MLAIDHGSHYSHPSRFRFNKTTKKKTLNYQINQCSMYAGHDKIICGLQFLSFKLYHSKTLNIIIEISLLVCIKFYFDKTQMELSRNGIIFQSKDNHGTKIFTALIQRQKFTTSDLCFPPPLPFCYQHCFRIGYVHGGVSMKTFDR